MTHVFGWMLIALILLAVFFGVVAQWWRARGYALAQERRQWFEYSLLAARSMEEYRRQ